MFANSEDFIAEYYKAFSEFQAKPFAECSRMEKYDTLARLISAKCATARTATIHRQEKREQKLVYYFSMEFLVGRLLENYLINLGVRDIVADGLAQLGESLEDLCSCEQDPGLGNGGLGRLAACFMDSMACMGIAGMGMGMRYRFGLFRQKIENGQQVELPDDWLKHGYPWESRKPEEAVRIGFGGNVTRRMENGEWKYGLEHTDPVLAVPYDVPVVGWEGETINVLRLWSAQPEEERFDLPAFNRGDYAAASRHRTDVEAISCILYPDDSSAAGKALRLKQEYFFVSAGVQDLLRRYIRRYGTGAWAQLPDRVCIHINDTHPALCVPELMRLLIDEQDLSWDEAWSITCRTISYTNHTILPEALEHWPIDLMRSLLPRIYMIIEEIDRRYRDAFSHEGDGWMELLRNTSILWDGQASMANLSVIGSFSVNGVAGLHTEILKANTLHAFYQLMPEKFNNKTNGVSHRRFLVQSNPGLAAAITDVIGPGWLTDPQHLTALAAYDGDSALQQRLDQVKYENKCRLANYIQANSGISIDPGSVFDIQVKRIHAYKRQLLFAFKVLDLYNRLKADPDLDVTPHTFLFAGKAAAGYAFAKEVIRLICAICDLVNNDPDVSGKMKVVFVENFRVSNAQLIYPAADISEQISTAGKEASGTGNMKFMMNGAITLGTLDGANVEISQQVGMDNIRIFGMRAEEVDALRASGSYIAYEECRKDPRLAAITEALTAGGFPDPNARFYGIYDALLRNNDEYFVLRDFDDYVKTWTGLAELYRDRAAWNRICIRNIAASGYFSSDRTIAEYAADIWHTKF